MNAINDAPTVDALTDITIDEDAGLTTVFLGDIGPGGGADEAGQAVMFSTASFNPLVIPSVSVSATEGGYDLTALEACLTATVRQLADGRPASETATPGDTSRIDRVLPAVERALTPHWPTLF